MSTPERRGAEVFATSLSEALTDHDIEAEVVALSTTDGANQLDIAGLGRSRWSIGGFARLVRAARRHDVLISNGGTTLIATMAASACAKVPFVYRNIGDPVVWGAARAANLRVGVPLRRAAMVAALYPSAADELHRRYGLSRERLTVIPNAASPERFKPVGDEERRLLRQRLGLDDDRKWVAYVGALSEEKRPLLAIEAVLADPRLGLLVAGEGPLRSQCEAAVRDNGAIRLLGSVTDVASLYAAADVVVIPSRTEGIPGAAIEAGLCGTPVVATSVGGLGHVVADGITGLLVTDPSSHQLAAALHDAATRRDKLGAAAIEHCRIGFSMDVVAAQWADVLRDVISRQR